MKKEKLIFFCSFLLSKLINGFKAKKNSAIKSILIIKLDEAGDLVYSTPVFSLLRTEYPDVPITLWIKTANKDLVINDPNIDDIITQQPKENTTFDLIIELRGNFKTQWFAIKNWPKLRLDRGTIRLKNSLKVKHPQELYTNFQVIAPLLDMKEIPTLSPQIYYSSKDKKVVEDRLKRYNFTKYALLHVGAKRALRKWSAENYAALASFLCQEYALEIVFVGDKNDIRDISLVQSLLKIKSTNMAGELTWAQFACLAESAAVFIGNESGPLHVASAMQVPAIGLFGPGEPDIFYPEGNKTRQIHHVLNCNPCDQLHCKLLQNNCMQRISLEEVKNKLKEIYP